ncbi:MAG: polyprotein [Macrobrachium rosenbergii virus 11]|nr:MAG: polyprotein [Macrobrachium rosenbergii virus 11]
MATTIRIDDVALPYFIAQSGIESAPVISGGDEVVHKDASVIPSEGLPSAGEWDETSAVGACQFQDVFERDYLISSPLVWTTNQKRWTSLAEFYLPQEFMSLVNIAPAGMFKYHALYKSNFQVTLRADGTNFNQGIIMAVAVPGEPSIYDTYDNLNYATLMNYPHVMLNLGLENTVKFDVPFGHLFNMMPPTGRLLPASRLCILVWSPLVAGSSAPTTLNISIWLRAIKPVLAVKTVNLIAQSWSSIIKPISHAILDNFNIPYADKLKKCGKIFGLYDRVLRDDRHPESGRCADDGVIGVNTKFNQFEVIPNMSHRYDVAAKLDLVDFARIPSLGGIVSWTTNDAAGTSLAVMRVGPTVPNLVSATTSTQELLMNTNISGVASMFRLFRGSIEVTIQLVATSFHRGNLFVAFDPYGPSDAPISAVYGLPGISIAVGSNDNMLKVRLPYTKHVDYVDCNFFNPSLDQIVGTLYVVVQNALTAPANVATSVEVLFYFNAGPDAEFRYPVAFDARQPAQMIFGQFQSGVESFYSNDIVKPGFVIGDHSNLINFLRRPEYTKQFSMLAGGTVNPGYTGARCDIVGLHAAVMQLHKYNSGGVMLHIVTNAKKTDGVVCIMNYSPMISTAMGASASSVSYTSVWPGALHNLTESPCVNFVIPGYNNVPFFRSVPFSTDTVGGDITNRWRVNYLLQPTSASETIEAVYGMSVCDDFMVYLPMSMFKLALPIAVTLLGDIPTMTATSQPWAVVGTNFGADVWRAFDNDPASYVTSTATTASPDCSIKLTPPANNGYVFSKLALSMVITSQPSSGQIVLKGVLNNVSDNIEILNLDNAVGDIDLDNNSWYDYYILSFERTNVADTQPWGVKLYTMQMLDDPGNGLMPVMTAANRPTGYVVSTSHAYPDFEGWRAFDSSETSGWSCAAGSDWLAVQVPNGVGMRRIDLTPWNGTGGFTGVTVYGGTSSAVLTQLGSYSLPNFNGGAKRILTMRSTTPYKYYRIIGTGGANSFGFRQCQFYSTSIVPLIAQGGLFKDTMAPIKALADHVSEFLGIVKGLAGLRSEAQQGLKSLKKILKITYIYFKEILAILNALYAAVNGNTAFTVIGIISAVMSVKSLIDSMQLKDEYNAQVEDVTWNSFVNSIGVRSQEAADLIRTNLAPSTLLGFICRVFEKFGYRTDLVSQIYLREKAIAKSANPLIVVCKTVIKFLLQGQNYFYAADDDFYTQLTASQNQLDAILADFRFDKKFDFGDSHGTPKELVPVIRKTIDELRVRSSYVVRMKECKIFPIEKKLEELVRRISKSELLVTNPEPATMTIYGCPGVGKSVISTTVIPMLLNWRLRDDERFKKKYVDFTKVSYREHFQRIVHTFTASESLKYDSFYDDQPIIVLDDAFTSRNDMDATMITRLCNCVSFEVSKADCSDKGTAYQTGFVIITTNASDPVKIAADNIHGAEKLIRRLGLFVEMKLKPGASRLDFSNIDLTGKTVEEGHDILIDLIDSKYVFTTQHYKFQGVGSQGYVTAGNPITFRKIMDYLVETYKEKGAFLHPNLDYLAGMKAQMGNGDDMTSDDYIEVLENSDDVPETMIAEIRDVMSQSVEFKNRLVKSKSIPTETRIKLGIAAQVRAKWKGFAVEVASFLRRHKIATAVSVAGLGAALGLVYAWLSKHDLSFQGSLYENKGVPVKPVVTKTPRLIAQGTTIEQVDAEKIEKIRKNIVNVSWELEGSTTYVIHGLFLDATHILLNRHFFDDEDNLRAAGYQLKITQPGILGDDIKKQVVVLPKDQRTDHFDLDVQCCTLSHSWPNVRSIWHLVMRGKYRRQEAVLIARHRVEDNVVEWEGSEFTADVASATVVRKVRVNRIDFKKVDGEYANTFGGDCGRPYYVLGKGLVGIHSAISQDGKAGGATIIPEIVHAKVPEPDVNYVGTKTDNKFWTGQSALYRDVIGDGIKLSHNVSRDTCLRRVDPAIITESECDYLPTAKKPIVWQGIEIDPLISGSVKWDTPKATGVPLRYIHLLESYFSGKIDELDLKDEPRVLSWHETINGIGNMSTINMHTSPGVWAKYFKDGKKQMFTPLPQKISSNGETLPTEYDFSLEARSRVLPDYGKSFTMVLTEKESSLCSGYVPLFPFLCTLKDELRPLEKVQAGKTRVFEQSSLDFVLLCRRYFGHFIDAYKTNAGFKLYHGIGRDKDGVWKQYAEGLRQFSTRGHCFDYKNFDGSLPAECFTFFQMVTDSYYGGGDEDEGRLVRHGLIMAMQNAVHIMGPLVFESTQGNKSGNAFTDVFNSISNTMLMWIVFVSWQVANGVYPDLAEFDRSVRMLTYGDDVVMAIKESTLQQGFDGVWIKEALSELGVTITSANKKAEIEESMPIEDVTFLKSPFVFDAPFGVWRAPLPIEAILRELKYRPKSVDHSVDDMGQRCVNVMRFLAHHERDVFELWRKRLRGRVGSDLLPYLSASYDALSAEIRLKQSTEKLLS